MLRKAELNTARDNDIIMDYILSRETFVLNLNTGGPLKAVSKRLEALDDQMLRRRLLTREQIDRLNS